MPECQPPCSGQNSSRGGVSMVGAVPMGSGAIAASCGTEHCHLLISPGGKWSTLSGKLATRRRARTTPDTLATAWCSRSQPLLESECQSGVLVRVEMDAVDLARTDMVAGVEKIDLMPSHDIGEITRELVRLGLSSFEHLSQATDLEDRWRGDEKDVRLGTSEHLARDPDGDDQAFNSGRDVARLDPEPRLEVIGSQHDRHGVDRSMGADHDGYRGKAR